MTDPILCELETIPCKNDLHWLDLIVRKAVIWLERCEPEGGTATRPCDRPQVCFAIHCSSGCAKHIGCGGMGLKPVYQSGMEIDYCVHIVNQS
jgi:hypothetical protein